MGDLLLVAAAKGDSHAVVRLLSEGAKVREDEGGRNALHIAATAGHADIVAALLLARWDPNAPDKQGCVPLQRAAAAGHLEVVKLLLQHGALVNAQDKAHGNTALHEASWRGWSKCVEVLCKAKKANLDVKNLGGFAPLHLACQNGHNQSCRELLLAGANPDVQNNYGDTPLHTSARYGHAGVTRILISAECKVSEQNKNGDTALHITAAMGRRKLTRILLEAGCDLNRRNKQGERPKDIAIRKDLNEIIEIMEKTVAGRRKREKGSGSSKDSSGRKEKKKSRKASHEAAHDAHSTKAADTWSPYGCHYYPDPETFPQPRLDSLPPEPLRSGEQYFLDLAGNIKKGPVGVGYTCYCAPFFRHMEARLERDKRELKAHIDAAQGRLDRKVTSLEATTRGQLVELARGAAVERAKCRQRHLHLEQWLLRGSVLRPTRPSRTRSLDSVLDPPEPKQRSSSREGKESGKGSSEVVDPGSDSEGSPEDRVRRTTRAMSERIDEVLRTGDGPDTMERLYGDLLEWRKHHKEKRPPRETVKDIIAKFQKQQSVHELVAKIQRKTDKIHKSAQKWKERHTKHGDYSESSDEGEDPLDPALKQLPFRCRDTVYSPDPSYVPGASSEACSPELAYTPGIPSKAYNKKPGNGRETPNRVSENVHSDPLNTLRMSSPEGTHTSSAFGNHHGVYTGSHDALNALHHRPTPVHFSSAHDLQRTNSPLQSADSPKPDSGYSTKQWGPSPSPPAVSDLTMKYRTAKPPIPVRKSIRPATASLV